MTYIVYASSLELRRHVLHIAFFTWPWAQWGGDHSPVLFPGKRAAAAAFRCLRSPSGYQGADGNHVKNAGIDPLGWIKQSRDKGFLLKDRFNHEEVRVLVSKLGFWDFKSQFWVAWWMRIFLELPNVPTLSHCWWKDVSPESSTTMGPC